MTKRKKKVLTGVGGKEEKEEGREKGREEKNYV